MKKLLLLFVLLVLFMQTGCEQKKENQTNDEEKTTNEVEKDIFDGLTKSYEIYEGETIDFKNIFQGKFETFTINTSNECAEINDNVLTAKKKGNVEVELMVGDKTTKINIVILEAIEISCDDMEIYTGETKKIDIKLKELMKEIQR